MSECKTAVGATGDLPGDVQHQRDELDGWAEEERTSLLEDCGGEVVPGEGCLWGVEGWGGG